MGYICDMIPGITLLFFPEKLVFVLFFLCCPLIIESTGCQGTSDSERMGECFRT